MVKPRTVPKATVKKSPIGYLVKVGKTVVGRSMDKSASIHLKNELNKSSTKRRAIKKVFRGFHR